MSLQKIEFYSKRLQNKRSVRIFCPEDLTRSYPVLYVHDGEYCFHLDTPDNYDCMGLDRALALTHHELIVVAISALEWQTRTQEYSPFPWMGEAEQYLHPGEEKGAAYLDFVMEEIKPYIESHYPVKRGRKNTFMLGCSLGAVISIYASARFPASFSRIGCCSLASWGNEDAFLDYLRKNQPDPQTRYFIRVGLNEGVPRNLLRLGNCYPKMSEDLVQVLQELGVTSIDFKENLSRAHKTCEWEKDMPSFMDWLFK